MKRHLSLLLCALLALSPVVGNSSGAGFLQNPDAIEETIKSVLFIAIFDKNEEIAASGSGFVAFNNGTIVTNHHVIEGADSIWASDEDDNIYEIDRILAVDEDKDIAILSIKGATDLTPLILAGNSTLKRGQPILTIGSPEGLKNSVSNGIISAVYDRNDTPDIQFTAPISHGSSGGALFNDRGEVIGITSAIHKEGQNINFAVGIYHVVDLYQQYNPKYTPNSISVAHTPRVTPISTHQPTAKPTASPETTAVPALKAPEGLSANLSGKFIELSWLPVNKATAYIMFYKISADGPSVAIERTKATKYKFEVYNERIVHYFKVASHNDRSGETKESNWLEVILPKPVHTARPTPTPAPISYMTPEEIAKYHTLKVGMNDPDVARLKERMYMLGYFKNKTVNNRFTETTAEYVKEFQRLNGLKVNGIATPEMQALFFSQYAIPKPTPTPRLSKPTNVKASVNDTTVTVTWKEVKGAAEYNVYRSDQSSEWRRLVNEYNLLGTATVNKYVDTDAKRGGIYLYKVESVNGENVSEISSYVKAVMPKPAPTPYAEPKYPLAIGDYAYWDHHGNYISFNPEVVNTSEKSTVDGFTLTYYFEDVFEEKIKYYGFGSYNIDVTYRKTIKPTRSVYVGHVEFPEYSGAKYVYVAVSKIHTTNGRTVSIPEKDWDYSYWTID